MILDMSTLALLRGRVACRAGSSCLRRLGSWSRGGAGDWRTGDTGTVEADEPCVLGGLRPGAEEDWGVQDSVAGFSAGADFTPVKPLVVVACMASRL